MSQPEGTQSNLPARSKRGSQAGSKAGSRSGSAAAPKVSGHEAWAQQVRCGETRLLDDDAYSQLPEVIKLRELVKESFIVPGWLTDPESPQYSPYRDRTECFPEATTLPHMITGLRYTTNAKDAKLSSEVEECLPFILHICRHTSGLESYSRGLEPMDSDRRHPMDTLGSLVWDFQSNGDVIYRTERHLQIPLPATHCPKPDACVFITMPDATAASQDLQPALSCFPSIGKTPGDLRFAPHWVTEFKRHHSEAASKRQVVEGLVSALYQRRALGFPNHFVFGTAHHSRIVLEVLAATWVASDEPAESGANPAQEAGTKDVTLPASQANDPSGSLSQAGDATTIKPKTDEKVADKNTELTIEEIKKYNKIVVYSISVHIMTSVESLLRLYLLMRETRTLARQYKDEIKKLGRVRIARLWKQAEDFYKWAPPPLPKPGREGSAKWSRSDWDNELTSVHEQPGQECLMSVDSEEDSDSRSDPEELDSLSNAGATHTITGEVGKYTMKNYAYVGDTDACIAGNPVAYQTA